MTIAKICGITNVSDAQFAVEAGADMLGFILYPKSPRYVPVERIGEIVTHVRSMGSNVVTVGVFVNTPTDRILQTLAEAGLDLAQLSGDESDEQTQNLGMRAYKAVRSLERADSVLAQRHAAAIGTVVTTRVTAPDLLLDANHPTLYGGSGTLTDESTAAALARKCRLLLAGGLTPANVGSVIRAAHPWGVDVASGVEASPGRKDAAKVRAFLQAVYDADRGR